MRAAFGGTGWVKSVVRWSMLVDAVVLALLGLLTTFKSPIWNPWVVGMVVPEIGLWLALLTICFALTAWLLRRGRSLAWWSTVAVCAAAFALLLKPTIQAWRLGQTLPAQLEAAFGPATPVRSPFSVTASLCAALPEPVAIETMDYAPALPLDFYRAVGRSPAPCVVVIHGGSWVGGNRKDVGTKPELNHHLARRGYAVASIDYRLAPEHLWPAQRDDLLAAIEYLKSRARALGIDPTRFVLLGRSAGGQMAPTAAYWNHDPAIRGVIAIYPVTDFRMTWESATQPGNLDHRLNLEWFLGGSPTTASKAYDSASAVTLVDADAPPTLILQGALDINVFKQQGEALDERLAAAGVPHTMVLLPWAAHGFDLVSFDSPGGQIATYAVDWFMDAVTR